ncbi:hypothetical protein DL765_009847 [Monosporascus sp. GIB2]|nr:hypothetical protein DL765_009847 [Monosporascus sp. GIB2]
MSMADHYTLLPQTAQVVPQGWFDAQLSRYRTSSEVLKSFLSQEIQALQDFHNGETNVNEAAHAITRPISTSSIPALGTSSDEIVAITQLWRLFKDALIEWPTHSSAELVDLLSAITKVPDQLHRGEALDDDNKPMLWDGIPYFTMVWSDAHWMRPGHIVRRCDDTASRQRACDIYLKQQDVESQLVAAGLFPWKLAFQYIIKALEKPPDPNDNTQAQNDAIGEDQLQVDFHIPAVASWIKHNGQRLYEELARDELKNWERSDVPAYTKQFGLSTDRWTFWKKRLSEVAGDAPDEVTKKAAQTAVKYMNTITDSLGD